MSSKPSRGPHDGRGRFFRLPTSRRSLEREADEEIRFHIQSRVAELTAQGASVEAAREQATREFGDVAASRAELADVDRLRYGRERKSAWWDALRQDAGYSLQTLRKQPAFSLVVVLILALGVGANATMFGIIDRLLLRAPAHVADPARLMHAGTVQRTDGEDFTADVLSYSLFMDLQRATSAFESVAAYAEADLGLGRGADAQRARGMRVTANYFATVGVKPFVGRFFSPEENGNPIAPDLVVLGHGFWQRKFGGDRDVTGRTIELGGRMHTIIGVAPRRFNGTGTTPVDVWVPLSAGVSAKEYAGWTSVRQWFWLRAIARVRPGVSTTRAAEIAAAELRAGWEGDGVSAAEMARRDFRARLVSVLPREARAGDPDARVAMLLGAVSLLVLLIACANVANLQLARGVTRMHEVALRLALGISRGRLVRQLLLESLILGLAAAAAALTITVWGGAFVRGVLFASALEESALDLRLLTYTTLAAFVGGMASGLLPALQTSRPQLATALRGGRRTGGIQRSGTRLVLLVVQAALSIVLLVGTGLFVRSLHRIQALPLGMEPDHVVFAKVQTDGMGYTAQEVDALYRRLESAARVTPGIESASLGATIPFYDSWGTRVVVPGRDTVPLTRDGGPYFNGVGPDFFTVMGMRILRGRGFTTADGVTAPRVVVVNQTLAQLWWPNEEAIGKCMKIGGDTMPCAEVVGIAENARRQALIEDASVQFFVPLDQAPASLRMRVLFIRPSGEPTSVVTSIHRQLQGSIPELPWLELRPLAELLGAQTRSWRLGATMFGAFGILALVVAAFGLYSSLAYDVTRRSHELGVRMALGAGRADIVRVVIGRGVLVAAVGMAIGFAIALAAGRWVAPLLYQTSARDPIVFAVVGATLLAVALLATLVPARRALRVDPLTALRTE